MDWVVKVVKRIEWNEAKNLQLQRERDLSFEQIQIAIEQGALIDIIQNPNIDYKHQDILIMDIDGYIVLVPFVEDEEKIFLKTAFKSRKATKHYIGGKTNDQKI
ncbi:MAG: toxin [Gammaproteobacteria bacterium]